MKILVTGASGFLGETVVRKAVALGHEVTALVRPTADVTAFDWPAEQVRVVRGDLRQRGQWCALTEGAEAIVHLAAAPGGDLASQFAGTVVGTENLLRCARLVSLRRFVHVSSFSVYDFCSLRRQACISESTPLDPRPLERDAYTTTKIIQEELVRSICDEASADYVIIRPGQIYGPGKVWGFGKAFSVGPFDVMLAPRAKLRLTYVDNCAAAILRALDAAVASGSTFNIVDDELPSHWEYYKLCRRAGASTGWLIPVPWSALSLVGIIVRHINKLLFRDRAQLPEILAWRRQQARWKPFSYTNASAKRALGWFPEVGLQEGVRATVSETPRT